MEFKKKNQLSGILSVIVKIEMRAFYLLVFWFRNQERQRHKSLLSYFLQRMHHLCYRSWSHIEYAMLKIVKRKKKKLQFNHE